jgi:hypothetical protein
MRVGISIEDRSNSEERMGGREKSFRSQVGDGRLHILTISSPANFKGVSDKLYHIKPFASSKPVSAVDFLSHEAICKPLPMFLRFG